LAWCSSSHCARPKADALHRRAAEGRYRGAGLVHSIAQRQWG
jgi:hypothetical protein